MAFWNSKKNKVHSAPDASQGFSRYQDALRKVSLISNLCKRGMLFIDMENRKVVISDTLSSLFITDERRWEGFLGNVQAWFLYTASQMSWNRYFTKVELEAVRKARQQYASLTRLQEQTIRNQARSEVDLTCVEPPTLQPFDFVISTDISDGSEPRAIVVGRYDARTGCSMVPYEDLPK